MNNKTNKLVLFGSQITTGGAQRVLLDQAEWFSSHGIKVLAVFFYDKDGVLTQWQSANSFPIIALSDYHRGGGKIQNAVGIFKGFFRLLFLLKKERPDAFEAFTHDADILGLPAAWLSGIPSRWGTHHGQFLGLSSLKKRLHTFLINSGIATGLVCVSERAKNQALSEGIAAERIRVIFNGVLPVKKDALIRGTIREELGVTSEEKMVLTVGRLVPEKAQLALIRAAEKILEKDLSFRFFIAGEGPCRMELEREIQRSGFSENIKLLGNREDVPCLLNGADLFVLCSETEGMPVSLMEAMSVGLPSVCSELEGIVQLMGAEDRCGKWIPPANDSALAAAIVDIFADTERYRTMGENARLRIAEAFSLEASCKAYKALLFSEKEEE